MCEVYRSERSVCKYVCTYIHRLVQYMSCCTSGSLYPRLCSGVMNKLWATSDSISTVSPKIYNPGHTPDKE